MHPAYHIYNNKIGIEARMLYTGNGNKTTADGSLQLCSYDAFNYKVKEGYINVLKPKGRGVALVVEFDSLCNTWQQLCISAFGSPRAIKQQSLFEEYYRKDTNAFEYYLTYKKKNGQRLTNDLIQRYTLNASCLGTLERLFNASAALRRNLRSTIGSIQMYGKQYPSCWQIAVAELNAFRDVEAHTLPEHEDSLRKLLKKMKDHGYEALISGKIDNDNSRKVTDSVEQVLNNLFAGQAHKPNYADVVREYDSFLNAYVEVIDDETGEVLQPKEYPQISAATINNYLSAWKNRAGNEHKRPNNRQKLINKYITPHSFIAPKHAGSIISVDDRQPPFAYIDANGNRKRMWFYLAIDVASEAFTGWVHGESKEGIILEFYRQLVRNYTTWNISLPAEIEGEISLNSNYTNTFLKAGEMFQYTHFAANNARAKRIERFFKTLRYEVERFRMGWLARPHSLTEANSWADDDKVMVLTKEQIIQNSLKDIMDWNNAPHSKYKDKTRWQVFMETQHPDLQPTNYHAILPYLGYETKTSCRTAQVQLNNSFFLLGNDGELALGTELINLLTQIEDEKINVNWIDDDNGNVLKAHIYQGANYVCDALPKPMYNRAKIERGELDNEAQRKMSAYVATVNKFINDRKKAIKTLTVINTGKKPVIETAHVFTMPGIAPAYQQPTTTAEVMAPLPADDELVLIEQPNNNDYNLLDNF